ncbi:MAG: hypothetical protein WCA20_03155 [Candidatus Sulfotelmatobacter sp.]
MELEILPVVNHLNNGDDSVVVMVANHAVNSPNDNNGPGAPRPISIDLSALGTFTSGSLLTIDANTSVTSGPAASSITPSPQMTVHNRTSFARHRK